MAQGDSPQKVAVTDISNYHFAHLFSVPLCILSSLVPLTSICVLLKHFPVFDYVCLRRAQVFVTRGRLLMIRLVVECSIICFEVHRSSEMNQ